MRAILGAAVLAVCGSSAGAAVFRYDLDLIYLGTRYTELQLIFSGTGEEIRKDSYLADGNPFGLPVYSSAGIGDAVSFSGIFYVPDDQDQVLDYFDNGGRAYACVLAGNDCSATVSAVRASASSLSFQAGEYVSFVSNLGAGGRLSYTYNLDYMSSGDFADGFYVFWDRTAEFAVTSASITDLSLAPVPLPASAALLPVGMGAIACLRRRRRRPHATVSRRTFPPMMLTPAGRVAPLSVMLSATIRS